MPTQHTARLRRPLQRALRDGHPWVYLEALETIRAAPGDVITIVDDRNQFVARGIADDGAIAVRVLTTREETIDRGLLGRRIRRAAELRQRVVDPDTNAYRLIHGEGDFLPGLVVDVYDDHAVMSFDGEGMERWQSEIIDPLTEVLSERNVMTLLRRSGRRGSHTVTPVFGTAPSHPIDVVEYGMRLRVDLMQGQKTGLFLDHRESRRRIRAISQGLRVLNLYSYTGGFSAAAGLGGATEVVSVDSAPGAMELARETWGINSLYAGQHEAFVADVPEFLRGDARRRPLFDLLIADPPSFAPRESALEKALEAYEALHTSVLDRIAPGGMYLAASCSSHVNRDAFEGTLKEGARRARRLLQVIDRWGAGPDHPVPLAFPEGDYLKVVLVRVL